MFYLIAYVYSFFSRSIDNQSQKQTVNIDNGKSSNKSDFKFWRCNMTSVEDFYRTMYPMSTSKILINNFSDGITDYISNNILTGGGDSFLAQTRVYTPKSGYDLRRTVKLDPIAEFFIYNFIYSNKEKFVINNQINRISFGFSYDIPSRVFNSPSSSYKAFKSKISENRQKFNYFLKFDLFSYFNLLYHHDLSYWFNNISNSDTEKSAFGMFLRQTNSGRSVDCLPQGIFPCKIIGSSFLKYIDNNFQISSEMLLRYMDDFYLFSDNEETLKSDYMIIQQLLGEKNLSINPLKTQFGSRENLIAIEKKIDDVKISLLKIRRDMNYEDDISETTETLSDEQVQYLFNLLESDSIEEEDAELVLSLMKQHSTEILDYIPMFMERFPSLIKNIYFSFGSISDKEKICSVITKFLNEINYISAYQLFWVVKMIEDYLIEFKDMQRKLLDIFKHKNNSTLVKAKILEIPNNGFGLFELRSTYIKSGESNWLSWASAIGMREVDKSQKNYLAKYFEKGSHINRIIGSCLKGL